MPSLIYTFGLIVGVLLFNGSVGVSSQQFDNLASRADGLSCYSCTGDACESPESHLCPESTDGGDRCFILFDDTVSAVRMGCRSELSESEYRDLVKQLLLCEGDNCNSFDNLPNPNTCTVCDSATDASCATNPSSISTTVSCQTIPHTQCYSLVTGEGHTARGCLQTLEVNDLIDCLDSDNPLCQTCTGRSCNNKIFPENRLSCHRCNSANDADCESKPNAPEICPLYVAGDTCVTKLEESTTSRGCQSELPCGLLGRNKCRPCFGDNCNIVDLIAISIGDPGTWQYPPLSCYACEGDDCATGNNATEVCHTNLLQNCATVFSSEGIVTARGCSDPVMASHGVYCDENPENCFECKSNECNLATSKSDYVDCIFCDGAKDTNCIWNVTEINKRRKCHKSCMTALYPRTQDADSSYDLVRSCLDDKDQADSQRCADDPLCQACTEADCNTHLIPEVRKSCYQCSGDSCQIPTAAQCQSYTSNEQCYILFDEDNSVTKMGCKSDYDPLEIRSFLVSKRLYLCTGDNCNEFDNLPSEVTCTLCSSRTDGACAIEPSNVPAVTSCSKVPVTDCYTRILDDGHTERGCLSSLEDEEFLDCYYKNSSTCSVCSDGWCNDQLFPSDRIACHTCNSASDPSCDKEPQGEAICLKYSPDQTCVTTLVDDTTYRGCSSELTCDPSFASTCRTCNSNNCNVINLKRLSSGNPGIWQELPLNCYHCSGDDCLSSSPTINMCQGNPKQYCVTVFGEDNTILRRGCSDVVEEEYSDYCDNDSGKCFNCNSNACNNAESLDDYVECVFCDSMNNPNCLLDLSSVSTTRLCLRSCMSTLLRSSENATSYGLVRTCLDDKDLDDRTLCGTVNSLCIQCDTDKCNNEDPVGDRRLKCNSCSGESCENPASQACLSFEENDSCFILFDSTNSIERMGCTSDLDQDELEESLDKLLTCSENNCNDFSLIPQPQACITCWSGMDTRCATNPRDIPTISTCSSLPYVDCYTMISSGATYRGCVSELDKNTRQDCFSEDEATCITCKGDNCNTEIFPEDRLRCYKCDSLTDLSCQDAPKASVACPIYSPDEVCSSKLVNDVTYRGCGDDFLCSDDDKQYCKLCNTTNCNRANLFQNNIGYPGLWQDPPINCYTCVDEECAEASTPIQACVNNRLQNCVTVFNTSGTVVQRGCSDQIYDGSYNQHCDDHPDLCMFCKSSGCNNADNLDEFVDCLFCDSATNSDCTLNLGSLSRTRKCRKECVTALYPQSSDADPTYDLVRSCLDDMDLDGRDECRSGSLNLCKTCEGDSCNVDQVPENRLSCWHCSGEECEDPASTLCLMYKENDRCFILFDDTNSVAQMGCKSDLSNESLASSFKRLLFCDGPNCNDYSIIPTPHTCLVCDSANDVSCATIPSSLVNLEQCNDLPYTSCYTRIEDGLTKRGCLSDIEVNTLTACVESGDDAKCNVCDSNSCNTQVYPADRQQCHRCSSSDDAECQGNPTEPGVCPIYQENDQCVVTLSGDITVRGCSSELNCNVGDRRTCRICSDNNCNFVDLLSNFVGNPGQWQDLPLTCYECEGDGCKNGLGSLNVCTNNNLQNCATVFDNSGAVIKRGCSDDVADTHEEYCDTNAGSCQYCKSAGCNQATSLTDYTDCVFCDSTNNADCVLKPDGTIRTRKCFDKCMVALYPKTSEEDPSYSLSRSCLDDKDLDDRVTCSGGDDEHCKACEGASCNNFAFPEKRHQCYTCRGDDCEDAQPQQCLSYHPNDQCYILFDSTSTIQAMGCRSEFGQSAAAGLVESKNLLLCDGALCNSYDIIPNAQPCVVCNSSTDARCATNPNLIPDAVTCSTLPYTKCYTRINENGDTVRGCHADLPNNVFYTCLTGADSLCSTCTGARCNNQIYPSDRLKCHRCNSVDDPKCAESPASNAMCPIYAVDGTCVVSYKDEVTYRGCSTELSCDESNRRTCRVCAESACNTHNLEQAAKDGEPGKWQDLPINCYTCEGDDCADGLGGFQVCLNNNMQNCMTVFNKEGVVIQRGCSDPVNDAQESYCAANPDKCYRCNSNGCNRAVSLDDYVDCLQCDTRTNSLCVADPSSLTRSRKCYQSCMTALYPRTEEENPSYDTTRTCLDDKDLDDRLSCQEGSENLCSACDGDKCNTHAIPSDRRSCYKCTGEGCQLPKAESCVGYRPNDQCFYLLDDEQSIIELGCKSDLTEDQAVELIKTKQLFLCDGDNCNNFEALPTSQPCALCNSRTDPNCAVNPIAVSSSTTCRQVPYTQCYSRVLSNGATERGCLSSLMDDEFYNCLTGKSDSCSSCVGANCNKQVYPENRQKCHICDSASDSNCEASPNSLGVCLRYDPNDTCVTHYAVGQTTRDCGTSLQCDASNRRNCRVCTSSGCNIIDLASKQDNNFGKWQDLPLSCHHCAGDECTSGAGESLKCENNNEQDCLTVFNSEGTIVRRGCSDLVEDEYEEYCDVNTGRCFNCKSNDCNTATELADFQECVYCNSDSDTTCVTNPLTSSFKSRQCQGACMVALYPSSSTANPAYDLIRTCLNDKEPSDQESCTEGEAFCKSCLGDKCNTDDLPEDRLRCHACSGDSCEDPVSLQCPRYKEGDQCFTKFDDTNSVEEMGCLSAFGDQELINILKTKRVYVCEGENCNSLDQLPTAQSCAFCDSTNDVRCATNPTLIPSVQTCSILPYTSCYTKITTAGTTERGCLSDLSADEFAQCILDGGEQCSQCVGDGCNKEIFPENRLRCYSCSSETDPNCEVLPTENSLSACPYVRDSEKCVTALGGNVTERGCISQLLCDTTDPSTCRVCSHHGCNTLDLIHRDDDTNHGRWQDLPLRCYTCSGDHCYNSLGPATNCTTGDRQDCTTVFNEDGKVIRRGCAFDVEEEYDYYCRRNASRCFNCKSNECNYVWEVSEYVDCVYCDTSSDATCVTNPLSTSIKTRKCQGGCMVALYPTSTNTNPIYDLVRTCLNDKEVEDQKSCSAGNEEFCKSCPGDSCNTDNLPEKRLRCHTCVGDNCEVPVSQECHHYRESDQCFIKFDDTNSVQEMGCLTAFGDQDVLEILKTKQVYICDGDDCNSLDKLPAAQSCAICDSKDDENCAVNPTLIGNVDSCSVFPYTSCYTKITKIIGTTQRGCLADLPPDEFAQCILDGGEQCSQCVGNGCNKEIFPENRLRCYSCSSETDPDCGSLPVENTISTCPYVRDSEKCVTSLDGNNITERGCNSRLLCDSTEPSSCRMCGRTGCNTIDLINRVYDDGYHGMWQDLPLKCHKCSGDLCKNSLGPATICTVSDQQDCMTVFDKDDEVVRRGCLFEVEDDYDLYCRANPERCPTCKSNECNDAWKFDEYVDCVYCNSEIDITCVTNPSRVGLPTRKCNKNCMAVAFPAANETTQVIRSCLDDKEIKSQYVCKADETGKECASCSEDGCNNFNYPRDRLTCHVCSGNGCTNTVTEYCAAYDEFDTCYAKYENGNVDFMGCSSDIDGSIIESWKEQNKFYSCEGDRCNALINLPTSKNCVACDSSSTVACATNPAIVTSGVFCPAPLSSCFSNITSGITHRGCLQDLSLDAQNTCQSVGGSTLCDVCFGEKCNSEIYPSNRRRCYICDSETDDDCKAEPSQLSVCPNYLSNNLCVVKFENGITERGCSSDISCDASDANRCSICSQDGCNTVQLDNGAHSIIAGKLLLTLLIAAVSWTGRIYNWF